MMVIGYLLSIGLFPLIAAVLYDQCNHVVNLQTGQKIYISSPYYPNRYPVGSSCRYTVQAPTDHRLTFKCKIRLNVPAGETSCRSEAFYFNREGSEVLTPSEYFCGSGEMERKSFLNRAVISYISHPAGTLAAVATNVATKASVTPQEDEAGQVESSANEETSKTSSDVPDHDDNVDHVPLSTSLPSTPPPPPPMELSTGESDAVAYIVSLLHQHSNGNDMSGMMPAATLVGSTRRSNSSAMAPFELPLTPIRRPKIVVSDLTGEGTASLGGSFTCLVEVVQPAQACECGWSGLSQLKLAGAASEAAVNEFPSMAGVMTRRSGQIFCGATIIHQHFLLSAAHCFQSAGTNRSELLRVVVGEHDTRSNYESLYTRHHNIDQLLLHENFRSTLLTVRYDVALLRTATTIGWNRGVGPACLPFRSSFPIIRKIATKFTSETGGSRKPPAAGERLITAGWGTTSFGGPQSPRLLKTTLDVISSDQCRRFLSSLPPASFCTLTPGSDTCQYDSGGPLYGRGPNGLLYAIGVVSYGYACATHQPSVNMRVASFLKWIRKSTPGVKYCKK